jgi:hypothetical protein
MPSQAGEAQGVFVMLRIYEVTLEVLRKLDIVRATLARLVR